ncbi:MAG: hypothetical protein ACLR8U_04610 [Oscillospiraceae bacterium]
MNDIVLPVRFSHTKAIEAALSGRITQAHIAKSENWEAIKERLTAITKLRQALDTSFSVYKFHPEVLPFYTKITAENLILARCEDIVFLFTDQSKRRYGVFKVDFPETGGSRFQPESKGAFRLEGRAERSDNI